MKHKNILLLGLIITLLATGCYTKSGPTKPVVNHPPTPVPPVTTNSENTTFRMYLIALEDGGKSGQAVGCGDSLVAVDLPVADVKTALRQLLGNHDRLYGQSGLYNALYQSDLQVSRISRTNDAISADLSGKLVLGGECDNPRVKAQLEATVRQNVDTKIPVTIRINGDLLDDLLSGK